VSHYQSGLRNVLDRAVLTHLGSAGEAALGAYAKVDEIPFDFERKMMSVVVDTPSRERLVLTKGAPESIFPRCTCYESDGETHAADGTRIEELEAEYRALSADGFRVLAVAFRGVGPQARYEPCDEAGLTLAGYVAFLDPPKETARAAVAALHRGGVMVRTLTGDNDLVARRVCEQVGIAADRVVLGAEVERMSDDELARTVDEVAVFARVTPAHKERIIAALQARGHVVGFLGDGVNDALALRAADVGISVDSAVDVAKAAADIVLLDKSLLILEQGVREGRKVFSNVVKYLRMGASSNFGNMLSVLGASAWLPFVPMAPIQVLTNNLLYDVSQVPIPTDHVDAEQTSRPRPWAIPELRRFILLIGPISSLFDYATFAVLYFVLGASTIAAAPLFQTGWFVESLVTQTLIIHVIRTHRIPFLQSRPSWQVGAMSLVIVAAAVWLPMSPIAPALGLVRLPTAYWPWLAAIVAAYLLAAQAGKSLLLHRGRL
jgi:Mg2+-importing ATPase